MGSLTVTSAVIYTVMKSTTSMGLKKVTQQLLGSTNSGADIQLQQGNNKLASLIIDHFAAIYVFHLISFHSLCIFF